MRCPNCNAEIADNSKFCPECGTQIQWRENLANQNAKAHSAGGFSQQGNMSQQGSYDRPQQSNASQGNYQQQGYYAQNPMVSSAPVKQKKKRGVCGTILIVFIALVLLSSITRSCGGDTNSKRSSETTSKTEKSNSQGTKEEASSEPDEGQQPQKSPVDILKEYEDKGYSIVDLDADVLYQYGAYYTGYAAHTAFVIGGTGSDSLKTTTESNESFSYSLVCKFEDKEEIKGLDEEMLVELVGVIENPTSFGNTITLNNCHILNIGETVQETIDTLGSSKEQQVADAESLKESIEAAAAEAEVQNREEYKASCITVDYNDVARNPDNHKDENIVISGEVIQVSEGWFNSVILRVDSGDNNIWYVIYYREEGESRILEGDSVTLYGECTGVESYTSIMGNTVTIPSMDAKIIE